MSKQTAIIGRRFSLAIAELCLLNSDSVKPFICENNGQRLYVVYLVKVIRKQYTHKYGYTSCIWSRIVGLAKTYGLDSVLKMYVFGDEKSARGFEKFIKDYVHENGNKSRGKMVDSFRIKNEESYIELLRAIAEEYQKYNLANNELVIAVENYIGCCNKLITVSKRRKKKLVKPHVKTLKKSQSQTRIFIPRRKHVRGRSI